MDPSSAPLLRRIRWGNVARLMAVPAAVLAVVGWSRLEPAAPELPAAAPRPVAVPTADPPARADARERPAAERAAPSSDVDPPPPRRAGDARGAAPAGGRRQAAKRRARRAARRRQRAERAAAAGSAAAQRGGVVERGPAVADRVVRDEPVAAGSETPAPGLVPPDPPPDPVADEFGVP
jgi:hypothetical protein